MKMQSIFLGGLRIDINSKEEIMAALRNTVKERKKAVLAYVNAYAYNLAYDIPWFKQFVQHADIVVTDGQGIRLACLLAGETVPPHLPLTSWIWEIMSSCQEESFSVYLLGAEPDVAVACARNLLRTFPSLKLAGTHHGYFEHKGHESEEVVQNINQLSPDILFVGFGMPLQEEWIMNNADKLKVHVIVPVGGCFDILAGKRLQAPALMRSAGLEWIWRLAQEPARLSMRYILGNPKFIWRMVRESVKH